MDIYRKSPSQVKKMHGIHIMRKTKLVAIHIRTVRGWEHRLSASNESLLEKNWNTEKCPGVSKDLPRGWHDLPQRNLVKYWER